MKRFVKHFMLLTLMLVTFAPSLHAEDYVFHAKKVVVFWKETQTRDVNNAGMNLVWEYVEGRSFSRLYFTDDLRMTLTPKYKSGNTFVYAGTLDGVRSEVRFYFKNGDCFKITVEYTDVLFTYYIE